MKKNVIKRRKRVPAAGAAGPMGRMSDQAAAEALVAVGRYASGAVSGGGGEDSEMEGDGHEQPKKKRARKSAPRAGDKRRDGGDEDANMSMDVDAWDADRKRAASGTSAGPWGDVAGPFPPQPHPRPSSTPSPIDTRYPISQRGPGVAGARSSSPFIGTHGGFELPPLNAAIASANPSNPPGPGFANQSSNAQSSYLRSSSAAPSRTHSPLGHGSVMVPGTTGGYVVLPPPHYFSGPPPLPPSDSNHGGFSGFSGVIPSLGDLERHYAELGEQKRKMEEMLERTDRMMAGVKRGIDEMRTGQSQQASSPRQQQGGQSQPQSSSQSSNTVPLARVDKERSRENVWPLSDPSTSRS